MVDFWKCILRFCIMVHSMAHRVLLSIANCSCFSRIQSIRKRCFHCVFKYPEVYYITLGLRNWIWAVRSVLNPLWCRIWTISGQCLVLVFSCGLLELSNPWLYQQLAFNILFIPSHHNMQLELLTKFGLHFSSQYHSFLSCKGVTVLSS